MAALSVVLLCIMVLDGVTHGSDVAPPLPAVPSGVPGPQGDAGVGPQGPPGPAGQCATVQCSTSTKASKQGSIQICKDAFSHWEPAHPPH